ncbi:MAG: energy transducer TonB [Opitutaceae bacterium]
MIPELLSGATALPKPRDRYESLRCPAVASNRSSLTAAAVVSASLHLILVFGVRRAETPQIAAMPSEAIAVMLAPPLVKELEEEPEPARGSGDESAPDLALPVPMQADVPSIPRPDDFVQALDFSSLLERPDLSDARISVIPENIRRGLELRSRIGAIFNLAELDRHPEPVVQVAPVFPFNLKRDAIEGRVVVEFVVDTEGRVTSAMTVESTHPGFEEAAVTGVGRWKFRPGQKNGRPVNTRMRVPILFRLTDA